MINPGSSQFRRWIYHIDRDRKKFECLIYYIVENHIPDILPCSTRDLHNEALFFDIDLPENEVVGAQYYRTL